MIGGKGEDMSCVLLSTAQSTMEISQLPDLLQQIGS